MNLWRTIAGRVRRGKQVAFAFLRLSLVLEMSYPISFVTSHISPLVPAVLFFFVAALVPQSSDRLGGDYYTFVIIGLVATQMLSAGLGSFGNVLQSAVQQGQFEMLLVEPIRWRLLPFGMVLYLLIDKVVNTSLILVVAVLLGANIVWQGLPVALLVILLGMGGTLGIGILSASVRVLAKRSDPLLTLYQHAAAVLAGVYFPLELLPDSLRLFSWLIPHTYVIAAMRNALMPSAAGLEMSLGTAVLALLVFNAVIFPVSLWIFGRSLEFGRKLGVLSGY